MIKKLDKQEYKMALELAGSVFDETIAPLYSDEGKSEFHKFLDNDSVIENLDIWGYYIGEEMIGMIAYDASGAHISLFFVKTECQKHYFGKILFKEVLNFAKADIISVHASPNSVNAYRHLGFKKTDDEITANGMRYVPMEYKRERTNEKPESELSMADLLDGENKMLAEEKEERERKNFETEMLEKQRKAREHQLWLEQKERKHQEYLEMKERKHQEFLEMKERKHLEWLAEKERRANTFEDKTLTCKKCGNEFIWSVDEQKFYKEKGFFRPSMCKDCRSKIKTINNFHK